MDGTENRNPDTGPRVPDPGFLGRVKHGYGHGLDGIRDKRTGGDFFGRSRRAWSAVDGSEMEVEK